MEMKFAIFFIFLFSFGCKMDGDQNIIVSNDSTSDIYYLIQNKNNIDESKIENVRPRSDKSLMSFFRNSKIQFDDVKDSLVFIENWKFRNRIAVGRKKPILYARSMGILLNSNTISQQIKNEYDGEASIFIIQESDLKKFSSQDIVKMKKYKLLASFNEQYKLLDSLVIVYK